MSELYVILLKNKKPREKFMEIWNPGRVKQAKEKTVLGEHPGEGQVWRSGVKARERQTAATAKNHCSLIITAPDPQTIIQISLSSIISTLGGNEVWWPMPVTLAHGSLRQKDHQSEASLSYKRPDWVTESDPVSKTNKQANKTGQIVKLGAGAAKLPQTLGASQVQENRNQEAPYCMYKRFNSM